MATASGDQGQTSASVVQFPHFDVVSDESDHFYVKSNQSKQAKNCFTDTSASAFRTIMKEWKILEKNLPESIYVRVYETRIDLLRAVIIGARGTPYHDGLFFFDIVFPSDYPSSPPKVHYLSHGYRMNPNLYSSGTVCLSLINTWSGTKLERWTPTNSTILQLLVSIQGLVLNDRPYFNEPGREVGRNNMSKTWVKRSLAYNEDVFILSCKTMLHHIRMPPKNFEAFVAQHFQERGELILAAIKAYDDGKVTVGHYHGDGKPSSKAKASDTFQKNAKKMHADLQGALKLSDPSPKEEEEKTKKEGKQKENLSSVQAKIVKEKPKGGFIQRIKGFIKSIF